MSPIIYYKDWKIINPELYFHELWNNLKWENRSSRRMEYWTNIFDRPYTYGSGIGERTYCSSPSHPIIEEISNLLEQDLGFRYEGCFLNGYETGKNGLSWHCDDDLGIDHSKPIAIVTLYDGPVVPVTITTLKSGGKAFTPSKQGFPGERVIQFKLKNKEPPSIESVSLSNGSLLLMNAGMQHTHFHQIPNAGGYNTRSRISLTFRSLIQS